MLRGELGFDGFVVSDTGSVIDLTTHGFARDDHDAAARALRAGLDMEMSLGARFTGDSIPTPRAGSFATLPDAVRAGEVDEQLLDEAVRRVLLLKLRLGLFEQPYVEEARAGSTLSDPGHREIARIAAERSAVLLRSVAVIGPFADDRRATLGPWVFAQDPDATVTVLDGMRRVAGEGVRVEHAPGVPVPTRLFPSPFAAIEQQLGGAAPQAAPFDEAAVRRRGPRREAAVQLAAQRRAGAHDLFAPALACAANGVQMLLG